jgi:hypothetical protein
MVVNDLFLNGIGVITGVTALAVSLWAAWKANQIAVHELRLSRRHDLHSMLFEIDREALDKPELIAVFKSSGLAPSRDPLKIAQCDKYIQIFFNIFELSYSEFRVLKQLTREEQEISKAWDDTIRWFLHDCERAAVIWQENRALYYTSFRNYIDGIVAGHKAALKQA